MVQACFIVNCFLTSGAAFQTAPTSVVLYFNHRGYCNRVCIKAASDNMSPLLATHQMPITCEKKSGISLNESIADLHCLFCSFIVFIKQKRSGLTALQTTAPLENDTLLHGKDKMLVPPWLLVHYANSYQYYVTTFSVPIQTAMKYPVYESTYAKHAFGGFCFASSARLRAMVVINSYHPLIAHDMKRT